MTPPASLPATLPVSGASSGPCCTTASTLPAPNLRTVEAAAAAHLAHGDGDRGREHRPGVAEGVELAALAAGIDPRRQVGQQPLVERPPRERRAEPAGIDAGEDRRQP